MTQPFLFDQEGRAERAPARAREHGADTSQEAAVKHTVSGKAGSNRVKILTYLERNGGCTGYEVAEGTGIGQVESVRRLCDLERLGLVTRREPDRPCSVKPQSRQKIWEAV